jgi:hypothetical protein
MSRRRLVHGVRNKTKTKLSGFGPRANCRNSNGKVFRNGTQSPVFAVAFFVVLRASLPLMSVHCVGASQAACSTQYRVRNCFISRFLKSSLY